MTIVNFLESWLPWTW